MRHGRRQPRPYALRSERRKPTPESQLRPSSCMRLHPPRVVGVLVAAGLIGALGACGSGEVRTVTDQSSGEAAATTEKSSEACEQREFGHIAALARKGDDYELRFDPAWFTSGVTANMAAAEDGAVEPGQPVPNDNYVVDESHRLFTYLVPTDAQATILVNNDTGFLSTPISVSELAQIVATGESSRDKLFEPLDSGVWIRYHIDTVCSLDQQYRP